MFNFSSLHLFQEYTGNVFVIFKVEAVWIYRCTDCNNFSHELQEYLIEAFVNRERSYHDF